MTDLHARDREWMAHVVGLARQSPALPYAAVLVSDAGQILAEALNETETRGPVWHAELSVLDRAAQSPGADWSAVTLYTTAEPCPMCMGAILFAGVGRVVYGTSIATLAERGWWQVRLAAREINRAAGSPATLVGGVRAAETDALFAPREPG
jgi:tRNA(Arg) A34 adenosine deaminase TadA